MSNIKNHMIDRILEAIPQQDIDDFPSLMDISSFTGERYFGRFLNGIIFYGDFMAKIECIEDIRIFSGKIQERYGHIGHEAFAQNAKFYFAYGCDQVECTHMIVSKETGSTDIHVDVQFQEHHVNNQLLLREPEYTKLSLKDTFGVIWNKSAMVQAGPWDTKSQALEWLSELYCNNEYPDFNNVAAKLEVPVQFAGALSKTSVLYGQLDVVKLP